jgi:hypothetical protein
MHSEISTGRKEGKGFKVHNIKIAVLNRLIFGIMKLFHQKISRHQITKFLSYNISKCLVMYDYRKRSKLSFTWLSNCNEVKIVPAACIANNIPDACRSEHHSHE